MTIIAFDGDTMAADRRIVSGGLISTSTKLFKVPGGVIGYAGICTLALEFIDWFKSEKIIDNFPSHLRGSDNSYEIIFVSNKKEIFHYEGSPIPLKIDDKIYAIGSGADSAIMAMKLGLSADKAVLAVSKMISSCGSGVNKIKI